MFSLDVNECDSEPYCGCADKKACINTKGSCECRCEKGYTFVNGTDCVGMIFLCKYVCSMLLL